MTVSCKMKCVNLRGAGPSPFNIIMNLNVQKFSRKATRWQRGYVGKIDEIWTRHRKEYNEYIFVKIDVTIQKLYCGNKDFQDKYLSTYASYEPSVINNLTRNTDIHIVHIIGICPLQICLSYHTYMSHCTTVVYI